MLDYEQSLILYTSIPLKEENIAQCCTRYHITVAQWALNSSHNTFVFKGRIDILKDPTSVTSDASFIIFNKHFILIRVAVENTGQEAGIQAE